MSYCRWSDGDCYVYSDIHDRKGEIRCCSCSLPFAFVPKGGIYETPYPNFIAKGPLEMINHLKEHEAVGHRVPRYAFTGLRKEAKDAKPLKYPVHCATSKIKMESGEIVESIVGLAPMCGYSTQAHARKLLGFRPDEDIDIEFTESEGIKKSEDGYAHPRDELTRDPKQVTCPECKRRMKTGQVERYVPPSNISRKKRTRTSTKSKTR